MISVHGGIGATWEHDAPLYFRRAQLSRRLLGGTARRDRPRGRRAARAGRRRLSAARALPAPLPGRRRGRVARRAVAAAGFGGGAASSAASTGAP